MQAAVDVEGIARAEMKIAAGQLHRDARDVARLAPAPDRRDAFADQLVVAVPDHGRHVGADDAGTDFEHADAGFGEA